VNTITRTSRACTFEALNDTLKAAIQAHSVNFGLGDIISDVLMCCETVSVIQKAGLFKSTRTSSVYHPKMAGMGGRDAA